MKICVHGACGRMGQEVVRAASMTPGMRIVSALESPGHDRLGQDVGNLAGIGAIGVAVTSDPEAALAGCEAVVDFSTVHATAALAAGALMSSPRPLVVAVTALPAEVRKDLARVSAIAPVLVASNLSVGAAVLRLLSARAARALPDFDVEILEAHHVAKVDAPSGTATDIVTAVARARGIEPLSAIVHGRRPGDGPRVLGTIGVHAVRGGTVTGEHQVMFLGQNERVTLAHGAESRAIFARGALRAATWLVGQKPGLYCIDDVVQELLGL